MSWRRLLCTLLLCAFFPTVTVADGDDGEREGGILGTGIVGTITELGSIYVNGQHILFDKDMQVAGGVSLEQAADLLPGHTVAVIARPEDSHWKASHIRQITPLTGPVQISSEGGFSVLGTDVVYSDASGLAFSDGDWVAVSGLWQGDRVLATRVDPVDSMGPARIEGSVLSIVEGEPLRIGQTLIAGFLPQHLSEGDVVRAVGAANDASLDVSELEVGVFDTSPGLIFAEGYLSPPEPSGLYTVLGSSIVSYTDNPDMIDPTIRYIACGENGELASMIEVTEGLVDLTECPGQLGAVSEN
ncbi:DUF5666 domain-containing protein [Aliiroseovarius sp. 2305UL8-7]|uniref:DUF5666 domain-containing protein n=1 Tax=Aliiroseovarius conchicola TaxID=3121637 RepID=UPI00352838E5